MSFESPDLKKLWPANTFECQRPRYGVLILRKRFSRGATTAVHAASLRTRAVDSLAHAVVGATRADVASITAIGRAAARAREASEKHSIKQVDRMLANSKVDASEIMQHVIPVLVSGRSRIVVAVDWTEFASNGHSTVAVSMITEHGRATPLMWLTVASKKLKKRRSQFEDRVLWRLRLAVPEHVLVTVLADRGFADTGPFWTLKEKMRFDYVFRFKAGTFVESSEGDARPAGDWVPSNGRARRLDQALMTRKRRRVPAVVCVKRGGMKESCLVTSLADATAEELFSSTVAASTSSTRSGIRRIGASGLRSIT